MKNMKRITIIFMSLLMILSMAACSGGTAENGQQNAEPENYYGQYVAIYAETFGTKIGKEFLTDFDLSLYDENQGLLIYEGTEYECTWTTEGDQIVLTIEDNKFAGQVDGDTVYFINLLNGDMDIEFAKEGSEAAKATSIPTADPNAQPTAGQSEETYEMTKNAEKMLGDWKSYEVKGLENEDVSQKMDKESLTMSFTEDFNVKVTLKGKKLGTYKWKMFGSTGRISETVEGDRFDASWTLNDGIVTLKYLEDSTVYVFTCKKG